MEIGDDTIEVRGTGGDTHLGGDDIDQKIIGYFIEEYKKEHGVDISKDQLAVQRLKDAAEKAKHELSSTLQAEVSIPFISADASGAKHFSVIFTRAKLEELVKEIVDKSIQLTKKTLDESGFKIADINEIIMVGGQTRMPLIVEEVKIIRKDPHKDINPDEVVALGAAVQVELCKRNPRCVVVM